MKTAIVTGASKGVGYATVKLLSENGYKVIAVSRDLSKVSALVGDNVEVYQMDITNANEIKKFVSALNSEINKFDVGYVRYNANVWSLLLMKTIVPPPLRLRSLRIDI